MRKLLILIILLSNSITGYAQFKKFAFTFETSPLLLYKYNEYEVVAYKNMYNYLLGGNASVYLIDKRIDLAFNTGLFIKTKNHKTEYWYGHPSGEPATSTDKYTFLSLPLTFKCEYKISPHYLTYAEIGIFLNWIVWKYYFYQNPDGITINSLPGDLQYKRLHELYFSIGISRLLANSKFGIGLKPYALYKIKEEDIYTYSHYNVGRFGFGISIFFTYYLTK
jgi:hypothetical protein